MAEEDIYGNKAQYERFRKNLQRLLIPAGPANGVKGKRQYHVRNKANLRYFERLFEIFDTKDLSYIRRGRLLNDFLLTCYAAGKDLKDCTREDVDSIVAFMHTKYKSPGSKADFIKNLKLIWKQLFPEKDEKGRIDESIVPYAVRHLKAKFDRSKEVGRNDRLDFEDFEKLVNYFGNDVRLQAYLTVALESLGRPQELLHRKLKDVELHDNYALIHVSSHGKEGTKDLLCLDSFPYLQRWLEEHPLKGNLEAYLFISFSDSNKGKQLRPENINKHIRTALKQLSINKRVTCYSLKRNGITIRRLRGDSDVEIQRIAGWTSTKQLRVYDKSRLDDVIRLQLIKRGLLQPGPNEQHFMPQVKTCFVCGSRAAPTDESCQRCLRPLDREKLKAQENAAFAQQLEALKVMVEQRLTELEKKIKK